MTTGQVSQQHTTSSFGARYPWFALPAFLCLLFLTVIFARKGVYLPLVVLIPLAVLLDRADLNRTLRHPTVPPVLVFLIYLAASNLFFDADGLAKILELTAIWAVTLIFIINLSPLTDTFADRAGRWFVFGFAASVAFLALETLLGFPVFGGLLAWDEDKIIGDVGASMAPFAILAPVFLVTLYRRWGNVILCAGAYAALFALLLVSPMSAAFLALLAATFGFGLVWLLGRRLIVPLQILGAAYILISPLAIAELPTTKELRASDIQLPDSWGHRLNIWHFAAGESLDSPIFGQGFRASRGYSDVRNVQGDNRQLMPLHPHNFALQIWLELGAVGIAILLWMWWAVTRSLLLLVQRAPPDVSAAVVATLLALIVVSSLSFGFWQTWWQSVMATTAVVATVFASMFSVNR